MFYAISFLSLLLFVISPAAESDVLSGAIPDFRFGRTLIESADRLAFSKPYSGLVVVL